MTAITFSWATNDQKSYIISIIWDVVAFVRFYSKSYSVNTIYPSGYEQQKNAEWNAEEKIGLLSAPSV